MWKGSLVFKVNDYGLDGRGSNTGGGRNFLPFRTGPGTYLAYC